MSKDHKVVHIHPRPTDEELGQMVAYLELQEALEKSAESEGYTRFAKQLHKENVRLRSYLEYWAAKEKARTG